MLNKFKWENRDRPIGVNQMISLGTNDLLYGRPILDAIGDMKELVNYLIDLKTNIILLTLPPIPKLANEDPYHYDSLMTFNDTLKKLAKLHTEVSIIDLEPHFRINKVQNNCKLELFKKVINFKAEKKVDLVHLNEKGFEVVKREIDSFFERSKIEDKTVYQNRLFLDTDTSNELLEEDNFYDQPNDGKGTHLPKIQLQIGDKCYQGTLDCASEATIISHEYYKLIKREMNAKLPELPISNISILGVTGVRAKKVTCQTQIQIQGQFILVNCLVARGIHVNLLLGIDFLRTYKANMNFKENHITLEYENKFFKIFFMKLTKRITANKVKLIRSNRTQVYLTDNDVTNHLTCLNNELRDNSIDERGGESFLPLKEKINKITTEGYINDQTVINKLSDIVTKNQNVFSDEPRVIQGFVAKFNVKTDKPFVGKSYAVPYSKRQEVGS